jgi:hypothetical protein
MPASGIYVVIAIVALFVVAILAFILGRREPHSRLTPLAGLAFAFVLAGIFFGEDRLLGYGLMGVGVILAVIDIFRRPK